MVQFHTIHSLPFLRINQEPVLWNLTGAAGKIQLSTGLITGLILIRPLPSKKRNRDCFFSVINKKLGEASKARKFQAQIKEPKINVFLYNLSKIILAIFIQIYYHGILESRNNSSPQISDKQPSGGIYRDGSRTPLNECLETNDRYKVNLTLPDPDYRASQQWLTEDMWTVRCLCYISMRYSRFLSEIIAGVFNVKDNGA